MDQERLLTVAEIALALSMSRPAVYRLIETGALPGYKIGRSVRVHPKHLAAYLERVKVQGKPGWNGWAD